MAPAWSMLPPFVDDFEDYFNSCTMTPTEMAFTGSAIILAHLNSIGFHAAGIEKRLDDITYVASPPGDPEMAELCTNEDVDVAALQANLISLSRGEMQAHPASIQYQITEIVNLMPQSLKQSYYEEAKRESPPVR